MYIYIRTYPWAYKSTSYSFNIPFLHPLYVIIYIYVTLCMEGLKGNGVQYLDIALESVVSGYPLNHPLMLRRQSKKCAINIVGINTFTCGIEYCLI